MGLRSWWRRRNIPTERAILARLYDACSGGTASVDGKQSSEALAKFDIDEVAESLGVSPQFLHDYLTMMDLKYRYKTAENTYRSLYVFQGERKCSITVPYAAAILAGHNQEATRYNTTLVISIGAAIIAIAGVVVQAVT